MMTEYRHLTINDEIFEQLSRANGSIKNLDFLQFITANKQH